MTINDLLHSGATIEGNVRVQSWADNANDAEVYFDDEWSPSSLWGNEVRDRKIKYIFPTTTINQYGREVPQIVIEVEYKDEENEE